MSPLNSVTRMRRPSRSFRYDGNPCRKWQGVEFEESISGQWQSTTSTAGSSSASGVMCGLCAHRSGKGVRTSVTNSPGYERCRSRTAAVSMTMSPADWKLRRISLRMSTTPANAAPRHRQRLRAHGLWPATKLVSRRTGFSALVVEFSAPAIVELCQLERNPRVLVRLSLFNPAGGDPLMHARLIASAAALLLVAALPADAQPRGRANGQARRNVPIRFQEMDKNNDHVIARSEWQGSEESFRLHDWDGDGDLSGDEVRLGAWREQRGDEDFDEADREYRFDDWTARGFA